MRAHPIGFLAGLILCGMSVMSAAQDFRVTLLGSGENFPQPDRLGPSILVEAGGRTYVFDAGRGVLQRLADAGVVRREINALCTSITN